MYDVIVIGAGVVGSAIARELSRYKLKIGVIDKEEEVACGTSKANSGIVHAGYDPKPGSLKAKLNVLGNTLYPAICKELDIPFRQIGSLVIAFTEEDRQTLQELKNNGEANGVPGLRIVEKEELFKIEPNVNAKAKAALYAPTGGIVGPYEMNIAFAECASINGVNFMLGQEVKGIDWMDSHFRIHTTDAMYESKFLINSAGLFADDVAEMAEKKKNYSIRPRAGEYCLMDKYAGSTVSHVLFQAPGKLGKGTLVTPTVDGNILLGPTAKDMEDKGCTECTQEGLHEVVTKSKTSVPSLEAGYIITSFTGLRAHGDKGDFIIEKSTSVPNLINLIGIESPGLTAAPAIPFEVIELLSQCGCILEERAEFNPKRPEVLRFSQMTHEERHNLIKRDSTYGNIVCRCEMVTEGEILDAIRRPLGARTMDGVKRRARTGSGRCHGGFCTPKVLELLSRELNISPLEVTKRGKGSNVLVGYNKRL